MEKVTEALRIREPGEKKMEIGLNDFAIPNKDGRDINPTIYRIKKINKEAISLEAIGTHMIPQKVEVTMELLLRDYTVFKNNQT